MTSIKRSSIALLVATAIVTTGISIAPQKASAGSDFVKGLIIGGGAVAIINNANKNKKKKTRTTTSKPRKTVKKKAVPSGPRVTIATFPTTREQVRDYQGRLNALGYNAGTPDGISGRMTRTAVSSFQASIGVVPTGKLSVSDAGILVQQTSQPLVATAGVAPNVMGQQPVPVYPTNGAGAQQQTGAVPAFPQVAAPAPAQGQMAFNSGAAPAPAFPTATPPAGIQQGAAPQPSFPAFPGTSQNQPTVATASAPSVGAAQPSFPAVKAAVAAVVATAQTAGAGFQPSVTLPVAAPKPAEVERFSILNVTTGSTLGDAKQQLAFEGFSNCEALNSTTHCSVNRGQMQDLVALQTVEMPDGSVQVGAMSRFLSFAQPMKRDQLNAMMAERYSSLLSAPNQMVGSVDCQNLSELSNGGRAELTARIMSEDNASLAALANSCRHFSRIVFGPDANSADVTELSVFIFDGGVFAAGSGANQIGKIKF